MREDLSNVEGELTRLRQALGQSEAHYGELQKELGELRTRESSLSEAIAWYDSIREPDLSGQLADTKSRCDRLSAECAAVQAEIARLQRELTELEKHIGSLWNPLNWLSSQQSKLRLCRRKLVPRLRRLELARDSCHRQLQLWQCRQAELQQTLQRYRAFDRAASAVELSHTQQEIARLTAETQVAEQRCRTLKESLENRSAERDSLMRQQAALQSRIEGLYREILRHRQSQIEKALASRRPQRTALAAELQQAESRSQEIRRILERYYALDPAACRAELDQTQEQLAHLHQRLQRLDGLIRRRDAELAPLLKKANQLEQELNGAQADLRKARQLEQRLSSAPNGHSRSQIHDECEKYFGDGRPRKVIADRERRIFQIESALEKIQDRIERIRELHLRMTEVEYLVIDGNNCCYQGEDFIGLAALRALLPELRTQGYRVAVIFDGSICPMLKLRAAEVKEQLGNGVIFHIVPSRQSADETILRLANDDPHAFVLSNDRFREYPESPVVQQGRLIRHEIVDGQMLVRSLGIQVKFRAAEAS
ncbi:Chromosome partition protein Smc [bacterium HR36]|nr:Chromosome partition protein Smc [bacterium HR36]